MVEEYRRRELTDEDTKKIRGTSKKYVVLNVDVSSTHTDEDLANIATHRDSGVVFSWNEFSAVYYITDLKHPIDYSLVLNDTGNDEIPILTRGTEVNNVVEVTSIYFNNTATSADPVVLLLEGE